MFLCTLLLPENYMYNKQPFIKEYCTLNYSLLPCYYVLEMIDWFITFQFPEDSVTMVIVLCTCTTNDTADTADTQAINHS